jgi:hypothetical protein
MVRAGYNGTSGSVEALAAKLHRTPCSIKGQVQELKLGKKKVPNWSADDLQYLRKHYGLLPDEEICSHLHRTRNGIVIAAKRHLHINRKRNAYTARAMARVLGVADSKTITETWMSKGYIVGRKSPTHSGMHLMWRFDRKDIDECLKARPWLVDIEKVKVRHFRKIILAEFTRDPWYSTAQAAPFLGVHPHTLVKYLNQGLIAAVKKPSMCWQGEWILRRSAIDKYRQRC